MRWREERKGQSGERRGRFSVRGRGRGGRERYERREKSVIKKEGNG